VLKHNLKNVNWFERSIGPQPKEEPMNSRIDVRPIGRIVRTQDGARIELEPEFEAGLRGLDGFSHIMVLYWLHENDSPERRRVLQVHPMKDPAKPLTGVFATHSPARPNLIAVTVCKLSAVRDTHLEVEEMDAVDGSPVLDIKCYIPRGRSETDVTVPDWVTAGSE
jgi:tRNA-Thr(GGU) m(6)t(6)A37 methyltransferase TsaA